MIMKDRLLGQISRDQFAKMKTRIIGIPARDCSVGFQPSNLERQAGVIK